MSLSGVTVDPAKVDEISNMLREALVEEDDCTPSVKKHKSIWGIFFSFSIRASCLCAQPSPNLCEHHGNQNLSPHGARQHRLLVGRRQEHKLCWCACADWQLHKNGTCLPIQEPDYQADCEKLWDCVFLCLWVPWMYLLRLGSQLWEWTSVRAAAAVWRYQVSYHGNGGKERFNHTLGNMLRTLPLRAKRDWPQQIQTLTFAWIPLAAQLSAWCFTVFQGFLSTLCSNLSGMIPLWRT